MTEAHRLELERLLARLHRDDPGNFPAIQALEAVLAEARPVERKHKWQFYFNGTFCEVCGAAIGSDTPCR